VCLDKRCKKQDNKTTMSRPDLVWLKIQVIFKDKLRSGRGNFYLVEKPAVW